MTTHEERITSLETANGRIAVRLDKMDKRIGKVEKHLGLANKRLDGIDAKLVYTNDRIDLAIDLLQDWMGTNGSAKSDT